MWGFTRSKKNPERTIAPSDTLGGVSVLLESWLTRMNDLIAARRLAYPAQLAAIDEQMEQLCQEAAENIEKSSQSALGDRIQRMKQLVLNEMIELRDRARS
jgi:hypothetical protein